MGRFNIKGNGLAFRSTNMTARLARYLIVQCLILGLGFRVFRFRRNEVQNG